MAAKFHKFRGRYNQQVDVLRNTPTHDDAGGYTPSWGPVEGLINVPCIFFEEEGTQDGSELNSELMYTHIVECPPIGLLVTDRLVVEGSYYHILNLERIRHRANVVHHIQMRVRRIKAGDFDTA